MTRLRWLTSRPGFTRTAGMKRKRSALRQAQDRAFTLIELLVVTSIIIMLISILLPALGKARYQARLLQCQSNMRQQYIAQINYATTNNRRFPPRDENSPDYASQNSYAGSVVDLIRDDYLGGTGVMTCPIVAKVPAAGQAGLGVYSGEDWVSGTNGGWNTNQANIYSAYMWLAAFGYTYTVEMLNGEPDPVRFSSSATDDHSFITHRLNFYNTTDLREISHGGRGLGQVGAPYDDYQTNDMPVCYGDGHTTLHHRDDLLPRMTIGGSYPATPGSPGTYIW